MLRAALFTIMLGGMAAAGELRPCRIEVVEKGSGWPVPLIELRTTSKVRLVTDNGGLIAFTLPEFFGRETWLEVIGHGYEVARDGFGFRGVKITPQPGVTVRIEVTRTVPAKCLGRLTGSGLFAESQQLGEHLGEPESGVTGCDTVQSALHRGRLFWAWGDTSVPGYALGLYQTSGATSAPAPLLSLTPPISVAYAWFRDARAQVRAVAPMAGRGPTWVSGYANVRDRTGAEKLVCTYTKIQGHLEVYEIGLAVWSDEREVFEPARTLWKAADHQPKPPYPTGHPSLWKDAAGKEWLLFGDPFPTLRMPATFEAWQDSTTWEPLVPPRELRGAGGEKITPHAGSIAWNDFRRKWVTVFEQKYGQPSALGELWYAEADVPTGPWGSAVKVVTHRNYTFYNPRLHPEFTPAGSPVLLFEGTYTAEFADHAEPTPRYDYNQILYRLDLDDPALRPAQNVNN